MLVAQGKVDEAEPHLQEAMTLLREGATAKPELTAQAANWLGVIRIGRNAYPEAEALMLPGSDRFFATNAAGYFLQETMNLGSPTNWITLNDPFPPNRQRAVPSNPAHARPAIFLPIGAVMARAPWINYDHS